MLSRDKKIVNVSCLLQTCDKLLLAHSANFIKQLQLPPSAPTSYDNATTSNLSTHAVTGTLEWWQPSQAAGTRWKLTGSTHCKYCSPAVCKVLLPATPLRELTCHMKLHKCYLPPGKGKGDIPALIPAEAGTRFSDPRRKQGWVNLGTATKVISLCPMLHITVAIVINTTARSEIQTWVLSHCSRMR